MTRISSFSLYQCKSCGQIHMHPVYASFTLGSPPANLILNPKDERTCQRCGVRVAIEDYSYVGKTGGADKAPIEWVTTPSATTQNFLRRLLSLIKTPPNPKKDFKHFGL